MVMAMVMVMVMVMAMVMVMVMVMAMVVVMVTVGRCREGENMLKGHVKRGTQHTHAHKVQC